MAQARALTIGGFDPAGRSGIQLDLRTFAAHGVAGASVLTTIVSLSDRGTTGSLHELGAWAIRDQLRIALSEEPVGAVKVGLVTTVPVIRAVVAAVQPLGVPLLLDFPAEGPGSLELVRSLTLSSVVRELFPIATLVCLDLREAAVISDMTIRDEASLKGAARRIQEMGPSAVLLLGGLAGGSPFPGGLLDGRTWYGASRVAWAAGGAGSRNRLSASLAARLALGDSPPEAVESASSWIRGRADTGDQDSGPAGPGHETRR